MRFTLVVLAAGLSTRFGADKQTEPLGPGGELLLEYGIHDAIAAGVGRIVLVVRAGADAALLDRVGDRFSGTADVETVVQRIDDLPADYTVPHDRTRPWGTGHAVLAARHAVDTPFVVCNADDFYGAAAYRALVQHLTTQRSDALVAYRLDETLSPTGGVSRAICTDHEGMVEGVTEVLEIRDHGAQLHGRTVDGGEVTLTGSEPVSMNLWGFGPDAFGPLEEQFRTFLDGHGTEPHSEFFLTSAVDAQIRVGSTRVALLRTDARWFGVTFSEDRDAARRHLRDLVARGTYPQQLGTP